jgi:transcriptional regulator with XRE-family HTH domain
MKTKRISKETKAIGRPEGTRNMDDVKWSSHEEVTDPASFSRYLKYLWKRSDISVLKFSEKTGINEQTLFALMNQNRKVNGKKSLANPTLNVLLQICKGFEVSLADFFSGKALPTEGESAMVKSFTRRKVAVKKKTKKLASKK